MYGERSLSTASQDTIRQMAAEMAGMPCTDEERTPLAPQLTALLADRSALEAPDLSQEEPAVMCTFADKGQA